MQLTSRLKKRSLRHPIICHLLIAIAATTPATAFGKDIRKHTPSLDATSQRPLSDIEKCIATSWVQTSNFPVGTIPIDGGLTYDMHAPVSGFDMLVDAVDRGGHREVTIYIRAAPVSFVDKNKNIAKIRECL